MKNYFLLGVSFFFTNLISHSQDSAKVARIDSFVQENEIKISGVYQRTEKDKVETLHGRDPENFTDIYSFSETKHLLSYSVISFSPGDTDLITNLYFDANKLIKAKTISFDLSKNKSEFIYYFYDNELINIEAEMSGIYRGNFYVEYAQRILKRLKKRPIRYPL